MFFLISSPSPPLLSSPPASSPGVVETLWFAFAFLCFCLAFAFAMLLLCFCLACAVLFSAFAGGGGGGGRRRAEEEEEEEAGGGRRRGVSRHGFDLSTLS